MGGRGGAVALLILAGCARRDDGMVTISFERDDCVSDFLDDATRMLERPIFRDPDNPRLQERMGSHVWHKLPRRRLYDTIRAVLAFYEIRLSEAGDFLVAEDAPSTNGTFLRVPVRVPCEQLARYADRGNLPVETYVPVRRIEWLTLVPETVLTPLGAREHDPTALIRVTGPAPAVVARVRAIEDFDRRFRPPQ